MRDDFSARATELGAQVHPVNTEDEAVSRVVDIYCSSGSRKVVVSPDVRDLRVRLVDALTRAGAEIVGGDTVDTLAQADMGISRAALGIAETGSIVLAGNEAVPRFSSMLPLVHVAVLDASALVPSLDEAGEYLRRVSLEPAGRQIRYASFVSGPSRTSDVEKTLTVGVHGPGQLHVILLS